MERGPSEPLPPLPSVLPTGSAKRMELVRLDGDVGRYCFGEHRGLPDDVLLAHLLAVSRDPHLWGVVLGNALAHVDRDYPAYERVTRLARAAGADEAVARTHRAWLLARPGFW